MKFRLSAYKFIKRNFVSGSQSGHPNQERVSWSRNYGNEHSGLNTRQRIAGAIIKEVEDNTLGRMGALGRVLIEKRHGTGEGVLLQEVKTAFSRAFGSSSISQALGASIRQRFADYTKDQVSQEVEESLRNKKGQRGDKGKELTSDELAETISGMSGVIDNHFSMFKHAFDDVIRSYDVIEKRVQSTEKGVQTGFTKIYKKFSDRFEDKLHEQTSIIKRIESFNKRLSGTISQHHSRLTNVRGRVSNLERALQSMHMGNIGNENYGQQPPEEEKKVDYYKKAREEQKNSILSGITGQTLQNLLLFSAGSMLAKAGVVDIAKNIAKGLITKAPVGILATGLAGAIWPLLAGFVRKAIPGYLAYEGLSGFYENQKKKTRSDQAEKRELRDIFSQVPGMPPTPGFGSPGPDTQKKLFKRPAWTPQGMGIPSGRVAGGNTEYSENQGGTVDPGLETAAGTWKHRVNVHQVQDGKRIPASVRYNNPGASYPRPDDEKFGLTGYGVIGGGHKIGRYPSVVHGTASNMDLFRKKYVGMTVEGAMAKWRGRGGTPLPMGMDGNTVLTKEMADDPKFMQQLFKEMGRHEAGRKNPITDEQYDQAFKIAKEGGIEAFKKKYPDFKPTELKPREKKSIYTPVGAEDGKAEGWHKSVGMLENKTVNPLLRESVMAGAVEAFGDPNDENTRYEIRINNAKRSGGGASKHDQGKATDLQIYDRKEKQYVGTGGDDIFQNAYGNPHTYKIYQSLARGAYKHTYKKYGEDAANRVSWGGNFFAKQGGIGAASKYGLPYDQMHFSLDEGGRQGSITRGAGPRIAGQLRQLGIEPAGPMGDVEKWKSPYRAEDRPAEPRVATKQLSPEMPAQKQPLSKLMSPEMPAQKQPRLHTENPVKVTPIEPINKNKEMAHAINNEFSMKPDNKKSAEADKAPADQKADRKVTADSEKRSSDEKAAVAFAPSGSGGSINTNVKHNPETAQASPGDNGYGASRICLI